MVTARGKRVGGRWKRVKEEQMVTGGDLTLATGDSEHKMQYTDDVLWSCTHEPV